MAAASLGVGEPWHTTHASLDVALGSNSQGVNVKKNYCSTKACVRRCTFLGANWSTAGLKYIPVLIAQVNSRHKKLLGGQPCWLWPYCYKQLGDILYNLAGAKNGFQVWSRQTYSKHFNRAAIAMLASTECKIKSTGIVLGKSVLVE